MMSNPSKQIELRAGSVLGRYELLLPIAKGGMAQVWAARLRGSRGFQKLVAIKTILPDAIDNTRMERMFLEEAQLASQIHHPNVVGTLELGEQDGTLYLVMDWVEGEPLHQVMAKAAEQGGLPLNVAVNLVGQACKGLYAAHELRDDNGELMGLVHRDISPQNLLISFTGTTKLVDFGIAKVTARSSGLTEAGEVKGKFAFMAPEQVRGQAVDCRTDLFALGIILYAITTGRHPFRGNHPGETLQNICSDRPPTPPSAFISDYPPALEAVVLRALEKTPDRRFSNGNEMLAALEEAMPEPLESSFDIEVQRYLRELYGARMSERRAALRVAQEQADRMREGATSSSVGTLRAISIDQSGSGSFVVQPPENVTLPSTTPPVTPARAKSKPGYAIAGAVLATIGILSALRFGGGHETAGSAAASSPVPPEATAVLTPLAPVSAPAVTNEPSAVAPVPSASTEAPQRKGGRSRAVPAAAARYPQPSPVSDAPVPPQSPAPAAAPAAPAAPAAAPAAPASPVNAWDRGAFGGRH